MFDRTFQRIREGRNRLPRNLPPDYMAHMQALVRVIDEDGRGRMRASYRRSARSDDYAHAEMFDELAWLCLWHRCFLEEEAAATGGDDWDPTEAVSAWEEQHHRMTDGHYSPGPPLPDDGLWP
jgi:hypothetical protein